jgi:hypothetical protein
VDPKPHKRFRVSTERFVVEVLGTRFHVDRDGVAVSEGVVVVRDHAGAVLAGRLEAGARFTMSVPALGPNGSLVGQSPPSPHGRGPEPVRPNGSLVEQSPIPKPRAVSSPPERHASPSVRSIARESAPPQAQRVPGRAEPSSLLARARHALAAGDTDRAAALVIQARALPLTRDGEAEADTLDAECALVRGDSAEAARRYAAVATRYPDLSAGENALFAAGRIEAEIGNTARALEHDRRYLERYPHGRFKAEAARRIAALTGEAE